MNRLERIDHFVLDRVEAVSHAIQRETGWNCFTLSRIALAIWCALVVASLLSAVFATREFGRNQQLDLFVVVVLSHHLIYPSAYERTLRSSSESTANPLRYSPVEIFFRLLILSITTAGTVVWLLSLVVVQWDWEFTLLTIRFLLFASHSYLRACSPLPPCHGRLWERFRASMLTPARAAR
jgi:hypothetical protein